MLLLKLLALGLVAGVLFGNGAPHFVKGVTREPFPSLIGESPVANLVLGWVCFVLAALVAYLIGPYNFGWPAALAFAIGVLLIGLVHASGRAFGRRP